MPPAKKASVPGRLRRVRFGLVLLLTLLAAGSAILVAAWLDRDLLQRTAGYEVRRLLERDLDLDFRMTGSRLRLLPLTVVVEGVTLRRRDEPWVLTVEEAELSLALSSLVFQRSGISNVRLRRPRFVQHLPAAGGDSAAPPGEKEAAAAPFDLPGLLSKGLPFRGLEIEEGGILLFRGDDPLLRLEDLLVSSRLSGGKFRGSLAVGEGSYRHDGVDWELEKASLDLVVDAGGVTLRNVTVEAPTVEAEVDGTAGFFGDLDLEVRAALDVAALAGRLGLEAPLGGKVTFRGGVGGTLREPAVSGRLALEGPEYRGVRWPGLEGETVYREGVLTWEEFSGAVGGGSLSSSGSLDFTAPVPEYSIAVNADALEPAALPALAGTGAEKIAALNGRLRWSGAGFDDDDLRGSGSLEVGLLPGEGDGAEASLVAEALLEGKHLVLSRLDAGSAGAALHGYGSYRFSGALSAWVSGGADDLALFAREWGLGDYGGRLRLQGRIDLARGGPRFRGPLRWEGGKALGVEGFEFGAEISASPRRVSMSDALLRWEGAEVRAAGLVDIDRREVDLSTAWQNLSAARLADLFAVKGRTGGTLAGEGRLSGPLASPLLEGGFQGAELRYGDLRIGHAEGEVILEGKRLEVAGVTLVSADSLLTFSGVVDEDRRVSGTFESEEFNLLDFMPDSAADVAGSISGRLRGTVEQPDMEGEFRATRLKYEAWGLTGSAGTFSYRHGAFTLQGSLVEEGNRYQITVEPSGDWPFEVEVALSRFSPELAREGLTGLPPQVRSALEGLSFFAVGSFEGGGLLRKVETIRADLRLEKVIFHSGGKTMENLTPLHVNWERGKLVVETFSLEGEDYHFTAGGEAGLESGWDVRLDGDVNLSLFRSAWGEIEDVDAPGTVDFHLSGPWEKPIPEGKIVFRGGAIKLRSLPDPIVDLGGEGEFRGRSFLVSDFSGVMGEGAFIAGGSYDLDTREIDAVVEGRLDLGLFKARVPVAREMKGPVEARLSLKGPVARPEIVGEARLEGAEVLLVTMPEAVTELTGAVLIEKGRLELKDLAGRMGNGEVALRGSLDWTVTPATVDLSFTGRRLTLVVEETAKALLDTDLSLSGDFDDLELAGKISFLRARYFREFKKKFEKLPALKSEGESEDEDGEEKREGRVPDFESMKLDVTFSAPDRFWIKNRTADLENSVDIHLGGTLAEPLLDGEIRLLRGVVTYFSKRFTLYSGRIFNAPPGIEPVLEAQAEVQIADVTIFLLLEGPLRKPRLQLTSVPPLSQEDLLALLTVGQTRTTLEGEREDALAVGAALVFTSPIIEQFGESARDIAGVELLQVEPALGEERAGAKVTVGTQLSDRLFMSASQSVGVTEEQQVRLEYQIFDYISVLGQQLRQGIYSLDLVFQYRFD